MLGEGLGATGPTGPTSRRATVSEPTRVIRPTNLLVLKIVYWQLTIPQRKEMLENQVAVRPKQ